MAKVKEYIVVLVTAKDAAQAQKIAQGLLQEKLIACANVVDSVRSFFWWDAKIDRADEALLIMKTRKDLFKKVCTRVKELHSYETPEVIALPIVAGSSDYLRWIDSSVRSK